jgi:hypothetical protein
MNNVDEKQSLTIKEEDAKSQLTDFSKILEDISSIEDKKKTLWKQIYINAITDRENSYVMFMKLYQVVSNDPAAHAIHGMTIVKYLERMSRANDQLSKLAELLQAADSKSEKIDADDIFRKIQEK